MLCLAVCTNSVVPAQSGQEVPDPLVVKALAIHQRALTIDTHVDIAGAEYATPALDPGAASTPMKCDLTKMEKGGLDSVFLAAFVAQGPLDEAGYKRAYDEAMAKFEALRRLTSRMYPDRCAFATSPAEVRRIAATGKRVIMTGVENGYPIGTDLGNIRKFYDLGARYITIAHSGNNQLADSSSARAPLHNGLSALGKQAIAEMNRLGMMVDVSHISEKSFWDIVAITKAPIIASHSGCKAITDSDRNLTDEQLRALGKGGGVIQVVALGSYLKTEDPVRREAVTKLREELGLGRRGRRPDAQAMSEQERAEFQKKYTQYRERMKEIDARYPSATVKDFADHIDHAVKVAGIDHVGIGTDFDGGGGIAGFNDDTEAPNGTVERVRRGYSEREIRKIWGENFLRVWQKVMDRRAH
jgi:microsomal dipeptidase-like Zn-dependent dipeptidase